ncbi:MAG: hypothetical protein HY748_14375 [Elusimicrobia bacterium]|nr:hypothetical protein [Elusimicrobiota bacterium]
MRWGPLFQVLVLAGAAMAAPQLFKPAGLDSKALAGMLDSGACVRSGKGMDAAADAQFKALKEERPSMGQSLRAEILRVSESLRKGYLRHRNKVLAVMIVIGLFTVAVLFLGLVPLVRCLAKFYLTFLYGLSCYWLMWLALAMFAFFAASQLNPWPLIPRELFYAPVGYLLLTGMFIRMLDPNYPLWNTLLKGLGSTLLSCAGIAGYGFFL